MRFGKTTWIIILITLFGAFLRLFYLDKIPNAIGGDELNYVLTAKAIFLRGSDLTGVWNPLSILWFQYPPGPSQAELPYLTQTLVVGPLPFSLFNARVFPALLSALTIPLLFLVTRKLLNNTTGLIAGFLLAINPWSIYIGRTSYEAVYAPFFFLAATAILLYAKSWKLLFAIPVLLLAFYSYIGTKLIFLPFVLIICWYSYAAINHKKYKNIFLIIGAFSVLLVLYFAIFLLTGKEARTGEILLPNSPQLGLQVDALRRISIDNPLTSLFENKPTLFIKTITEKLYKTFSLDYLFFSGDSFFSINRHGLFYIIDLPFIILGLIGIFRKNRKVFYLLVSLIFLSVVPQIFHTASTSNFSHHLALMYSFVLIAAAYGVYSVSQKLHFSKLPIVICGVYLLFLLNFLQIYFFQHSLQGYFDFNMRTLSTYANLSSQKNPTVIMTTKNAGTFQKYLFYTNGIQKSTLESVEKALTTASFKSGNVIFTECPLETQKFKKNTVYIVDINCTLPKEAVISLAQLKDGGETYGIIHDFICKNVVLSTYPDNIVLNDFAMEALPADRFCKAFVVKQ